MSVEPKCEGINCPLKHSCGHYDEVIHESDIAFTHSPYNHRLKKCEHYFGVNAKALMEHVKNILNGSENNNGI